MKLFGESGRKARARSEASEWFVAFCEDEVDRVREDAFGQWLQSSGHNVRAFLRISALWQSANALQDWRPAVAAARRQSWSAHPWRVAACIMLLAVAAVAAWWQFERPRAFATTAGQRRTITLKDGSSVELNARSNISVVFGSRERMVRLTEGQALFSVVKDPQRPFVVQVDGARVTAVGTQFDIYRKPGEAAITVVEGQVSVSRENTAADSLDGTILISAGEQARLRPQSPWAASRTDVAAATSWTRGVLTFDSTPLEQIVAEYNRTGTRRLIIEDPDLLKFHISGAFPAADPQFVVKFLQRRFAIVVEETPGAIRVNTSTHR